jgi:hypothetical protein
VFEKKKATVTFVTFFDSFVTKKGDDNYCSLYHGFATKKVMVAMSSPSSMLVVL